MTITFPRDLPDPFRIRQADFDVDYQQVRAPTRGGLVQVANVGADLWRAKFVTVPLHEEEAEAWRAWLHSLRGGAKLFRMWSPVRRYGINYPNGYGALTRAGGGSFSAGTATLSAIATARDTITLTTLPAGLVFRLGDLISIPFGTDGRTLHRAVEQATANGSGEAMITVEPTVPIAVTTGATVDLVKPWCKGVVEANSIKSTWTPGRMCAISFDAVQVY